jgi:DNA replication protein DnaC
VAWVIINTNLSFSEWAGVFGDANMATTLLDRKSTDATCNAYVSGPFILHRARGKRNGARRNHPTARFNLNPA